MSNRLASFEFSPSLPAEPSAQVRPLSWRATRRAFAVAGRGLWEVWMREPHVRLLTYAAACVIAAGHWYRLSRMEWLWIAFAIGLVIFAELMNTAIERTVDLAVGLRPDPLARHVKDVAAGCVLVSVALAVVIGLVTFLPHAFR